MTNLQDFIIEDGTLKKYLGESLDVIVPEGVTDIDLNVFGKDRTDIVSIKLPKGLKGLAGVDRPEIAAYWGMFLGCKRLESVELPEGLEEIGISAFNNCKSLKKLNIPKSVKKIGYHAFHKCDALAYLIVPGIPLADLEYKQKCALGFCVSPESFTDALALEYEKYIKKYREKLIKMAVQYRCKEALDYLDPKGERELEDEKEKEVDLAFLKSTLTITNYLAEIDNKERFPEIKKIIEALEVQGKKLNVTYSFLETIEPTCEIMGFLLDKANFKGATKANLLRRAVENNTVSFVNLYLEKGVLKTETQYDDLFEIALKHDYAEIKSALLEYSNSHFCKELKEDFNLGLGSRVTVSEMKKSWLYKKKDDGTLVITGYKGNELSVEVPETIGKDIVSEIGEYAFSSYAPRLQPKVKEIRERIKEITIPQSIKCIAANAFVQCNNLEKLVLPDTVCEGDLKLISTSKLKEIIIPEGIKQVVFRNCYAKVGIPSSVIGIDYTCCNINYSVHGANKKYSSIDGALLNKAGTKLISYSACLDNVYKVPKNVKVIEPYALIDCDSVVEIEFPETVETIMPQSFAFTKVKTVYVHGVNTVIKDSPEQGNSKYPTGSFHKGIEIHGKRGSLAEQYAKDYGNTFVEL